MNGVRLDHAECLALLSRGTIGRVVFTAGGLPVVHPVTFVVEAGTITFPPGDDRVRGAARRGDVVAFQVDEIDVDRYHGWTVTVIGRCSLIVGAVGDQVRIPVEAIDGRLLGAVQQVTGVRRQVPS
jgi:nitroimidazol reductase NimA-like FMN-containing flavoprotein (pyridoxamine 5'-phosphate oxidase superfamily)